MATAKKKKAPAKKKAAAKRKKAAPKRKAVAKKKAPVKKKAPAKKKAAAKKKAPAKKKVVRLNVFRDAVSTARDQMDQWVDTAKLRAKQLAAEQKLMEKKAELAVKAEVDKAKHLADQAEKWARARVKSDTKKLNDLEKRLRKQLKEAEKKLLAQAKAAEKRAAAKSKALKKKIEAATGKVRRAPARKKKAAPKAKK
ncbi:MAG: histone H1 [Pseudomonadota bacterium]